MIFVLDRRIINLSDLRTSCGEHVHEKCYLWFGHPIPHNQCEMAHNYLLDALRISTVYAMIGAVLRLFSFIASFFLDKHRKSLFIYPIVKSINRSPQIYLNPQRVSNWSGAEVPHAARDQLQIRCVPYAGVEPLRGSGCAPVIFLQT